jgi:hypothetical protein
MTQINRLKERNGMKKSLCVALIIIMLCLAGTWDQAAGAVVSPEERGQIINHLIPMPKEIEVKEILQIAADEVKLTVATGSGEVVQSAVSELKSMFTGQVGGNMNKGSFEILVGVIDGEGRVEGIDMKSAASRLKDLPNSDQAYVIQAAGKNRLVVAALNENGVYYGVTTLRQLLESGFSKPTVTIPLVIITDWPDLEQRGIWDDGFSKEQIQQLSAYKYNTVNVEVDLKVDEQGRSVIKRFPLSTSKTTGWNIERDGMDFSTYSYLHGIKSVPFIMHLGHLPRTGIYEKYPEAMGQGEWVKVNQSNLADWRAPCSQNPQFRKVLADWIVELAKLPHVDEVAVHLTEDHVYCSCPRCLEQGQYVAEAEAIIAAWREAQKVFPKLKLQLLLTQGSYPVNDKVLAVVPKDIRILYYDGGQTYNSSRQPMIYPLLEQYAANGGWLAVYPQLTVSWAFVIPWQCPQFIKERMTEFVEKKLRAMIGYVVPTTKEHDFNVAGGGEWCWNAYGRNESEFTTAWATRKGMANPKAVAEWLDTLGPVSWDLYGSSFPYQLLWLDAAVPVKMRVAPAWGRIGILRYFDGPEVLDRNIAQCEKALVIARRIGNPEFIEENEITLHYYGMLKTLTQIMDCLSSNPQLTEEHKQYLRKCAATIIAEGDKVAELLLSWDKHRGLDTEDSRTRTTRTDTVKIANKVAVAICDLLGDPIPRIKGIGPDQ